MRRRILVLLVALAVGACSHAQSRSTVRTKPTPSPKRTTPDATPAPPRGLTDVDRSITVRMRYATPDNFTGAPLPGYHANRAWLRPEAAAALTRAEAAVRSRGYTLVVLDAYRPVRATRAMVAWADRTGHRNLVGPYIGSHSEHNRGTAVDVTLGRPDGTELDMGTPFDTFGPGAHFADASPTALARRRILRDAMSDAGFASYDTEWWHFSMYIRGATALDVEIR